MKLQPAMLQRPLPVLLQQLLCVNKASNTFCVLQPPKEAIKMGTLPCGQLKQVTL